MGKHTVVALTAALSVGLLLLPGCKRGPDPQQEKTTQLQQQYTDIEQAYVKLKSARTELAGVTAELAQLEAVEEGKRSVEQKAKIDELKAKVEPATATTTSLYEDVQTRLADYLTIALNEFPDAPATATALKLYADEAILNADEIVRTAGHYQKAIEVLDGVVTYYQAANLQPYPPVVEKIKEMESWRFITQERFDQVQKKMTQDEVKQLAGVPYMKNIREDKERGITFWLYPKREGGAAAVYFDKKNLVYQKNFDAVTTKVVE